MKHPKSVFSRVQAEWTAPSKRLGLFRISDIVSSSTYLDEHRLSLLLSSQLLKVFLHWRYSTHSLHQSGLQTNLSDQCPLHHAPAEKQMAHAEGTTALPHDGGRGRACSQCSCAKGAHKHSNFPFYTLVVWDHTLFPHLTDHRGPKPAARHLYARTQFLLDVVKIIKEGAGLWSCHLTLCITGHASDSLEFWHSEYVRGGASCLVPCKHTAFLHAPSPPPVHCRSGLVLVSLQLLRYLHQFLAYTP